MEHIFSTKERIKILEAIIFRTDLLSVNTIANQLRLSKGLVSKYFDILAKQGILKKRKGKFSVVDSPLTKAARILLNLRRIDVKIFQKYPFVKSVGLYGSCVRGENTEDSDLDVWVRIKETKDRTLASLTSELSKKVSEVKLLFLTDKKIEKLKDEDRLFYHALTFGSIILYGDKNGIQL